MSITNDAKIQMIMNQTNYSKEETLLKMIEHNNDHMKIIKLYLGIPEKKQEPKMKTINQEIYRQIRTKIDTSDYRKSHPIDINQVITNLRESEELEQQKQQNNKHS